MIKPVRFIEKENIVPRSVNYSPRTSLRTVISFIDEIFLDINFPNTKGYMISNYGRVYNKETGYLMKQGFVDDEYLKVKLNGKDYLVHRLVLQTFNPIPNPEDYQVNHKDTIKTNNCLYNLEWVNNSGNLLHAYENNLRVQGEDHPWATISEDQVHIICKSLEERLPYEKIITERLGLEFSDKLFAIISSIKRKDNWKSISKHYNIPDTKTNKQTFTNDEVIQICKYFEQGLSFKEILEQMERLKGNGGYTDNKNDIESLRKIKNREQFADLSKDYNF